MIDSHLNEITGNIIGASIEVHRQLDTGLLESAYKECLCREFIIRNIYFEKEKPLPFEYKGAKLECGYRLDFLVEKSIVLEIKAIETIAPIHEAQIGNIFEAWRMEIGTFDKF